MSPLNPAPHATSRPRPAPPPAAGWSADRGDGTYQNPILFADYSDPDAIRVGDDYWLTASSFSHVPGLPILHSTDLVNWTLVNHALPRLVPAAHFSLPRHGGGVWAPALRHHAGIFWLYYPDPDFGLYVVTADDPRGAWSEPVMVKPGLGLIDPCPFWDDDGAGYLIHGWAKSRAGIKNRVTLHRLSADNLRTIGPGEIIVDADKIEGWHTVEGPKLYKRAGYYYVFAPAGGVRDGYQAVFRSRQIRGPYEHRIVLAQGTTAINGPHQGAWVDTPAGEHAFLHFQEQPAFGRVVHLQPMTWRDDWPVMGEHQDSHGVGEPVTIARKPAAGKNRASQRMEYGGASALPGGEWQWQANPQPGWFSSHGETWRLPCVPSPRGATLWTAANLLMRKFEGPAFVATTTLRLNAAADGDRAGLVIFGYDYAWLGLKRERGVIRLGLHVCLAANEGGAERCVATVDFAGTETQLRVAVDETARCQFFVRAGAKWEPVGPPFQATSSMWVGAKVGLFACAEEPSAEARADFRHFDLRVAGAEKT